MLIAIVGTHCAGKSTVEDYFVSRQGFRSVRIISPNNAGPQSDSVEVRGFEVSSESVSILYLGPHTDLGFGSGFE